MTCGMWGTLRRTRGGCLPALAEELSSRENGWQTSLSGPCPHPALRAPFSQRGKGSRRGGGAQPLEGLAPSGPLPLGEGGPERSEGPGEGKDHQCIYASRDLRQCRPAAFLEKPDSLLTGDAWEVVEKHVQAVAAFDVSEPRANR